MKEVPGMGPDWTPISPSAGSFFHADTHLGHDPSPDCSCPDGYHPQLVRLLGEGASRACWAQLKCFLRIGAGSPARAVLVSTCETSTTRRRPRSGSTLTSRLVPAGTET